jgi:hypothetical protein
MLEGLVKVEARPLSKVGFSSGSHPLMPTNHDLSPGIRISGTFLGRGGGCCVWEVRGSPWDSGSWEGEEVWGGADGAGADWGSADWGCGVWAGGAWGGRFWARAGDMPAARQKAIQKEPISDFFTNAS